jgi:hypothetical protein
MPLGRFKKARRGCDYSDDVNTLGGNIRTIKRNTEVSLGASKQIGLEANAEKTKYYIC